MSEHTREQYIIEPHGPDGHFVLYFGRGMGRHGYNLCSLHDFDCNGALTRDAIVKALNADPAAEIKKLKGQRDRAVEALKVCATVLRDLRDDWRWVAGAESIQYIRAENADRNARAAIADIEGGE